ncbi:MAG: hypothetical protein IJS90_05155 [Clostridia bacterium]|nr:hypothetical protein [Clostridia bacterium]
MKDIIIREIVLPSAVRAFTLPDEQGDYNVYINSSLSDEQRKKSFQHELMHISRDDFYKRDMTAAEIEAQF